MRIRLQKFEATMPATLAKFIQEVAPTQKVACVKFVRTMSQHEGVHLGLREAKMLVDALEVGNYRPAIMDDEQVVVTCEHE